MTAVILRRWGINARPVLVGASLRGQVATLLPMTLLFNHAVLEVEVAGKTRWFDLTEQAQGGDFSNQSIPWFGHGLPIDAASAGLRAQPGERPRGVYAWRETILLDTRRGGISLVEHRIRAEGWQADLLRQMRQAHGAEEFLKERDHQTQRRYGKASRLGTLEWRDDRAKNVCEFAEVFEVRDAVYPDENGQRALFDVPPNLILQSIAVPEDKPRRSPWAMPYPLEIRHEITVKAAGMTSGNRRRRQWAEEGFSASLDEPRSQGSWSKTIQLTTTTPEIPPERLPVFRKHLEKFLLETGWRLYLPLRQPRPHRGNGFGALPLPADTAPARVAPPPVEEPPRPIAPPLAESDLKKASRSGRHRQKKKNTFHIPIIIWRIVLVILVLIALGLLRFFVM
jgi:hypothetical protein